ncbi:20187_t:CDS:2 [Gigaspora margarita]|uniref:20187_t:CDS:1 n=1 Tax=Gigaspora margarita TaxID=4874 RepID=A0ABN7UI48_GIGMA|nr:20187_t:CDS:2 [Gigaspora margarita]
MYDKEPTPIEVQQTIAEPSGSTGSSNQTLKEEDVINIVDNNEYLDVPQTRPRKDNGAIATFNRLSDRYTFSFSADLISQKEQELETLETAINDDEGTFSVHQVHHSASNMYSQGSTSRDLDRVPKKSKKSSIFSFLRGRTKSRPTTFSDISIEPSVIDNEDITMSNESDLRRSSHLERPSLTKKIISGLKKLVTCS